MLIRKIKNLFSFFISIPRRVILFCIKMYQGTISFDHGVLRGAYPNGFCRFYPSCSQYGYEAFERYGIARGAAKTLWRVARCNPWSKGGVDRP